MKKLTLVLALGLFWATSIADAALVSYWDYDSTVGTTISDRVPGSTHDGTLTGGAAITTGGQGFVGGEALNPNADGDGLTSGHMLAGDPTTYDFNTSFTWHARVKTPISSGDKGIIGRAPLATNHNQGSKTLFIRNNSLEWDSGWVGVTNSGTNIGDDAWHQVIAVFEATTVPDPAGNNGTGNLAIYLDGTAVVDQAFNANMYDEHLWTHNGGRAETSLRIGNGSNNFISDEFPGLIDDVAIFDTDLQGDALTLLIDQGPAGFMASTLTWDGATQLTGKWSDPNWIGPDPPPPPPFPVDDETYSIAAVVDTPDAVVTVADDDRSAFALTVGPGSQVTIGAGKTLAITSAVEGAGTIALEPGAQLTAGGGGTIASATIAGTSTIDIGSGRMSVASLSDSGTAATLAKTGDGTLTLEDVTTLAGSSFRVEAGTLFAAGSSPLGNAETLTLADGTFRIASRGLVDDPIGKWDFENVAPPTVPNLGSAGGALNGTMEGNAAIAAAGGFDGLDALLLDGDDDDLNFGDVAQMDTPGEFSVSIWFRRDVDNSGGANDTNHGVNNVLFAQSSNADNDNLEIGTEGDQFEIYVDSAAGAPTLRTTVGGGGITNGQWHHAAVTYDENDGNELKLYFDGSFVQQWSDPAGPLDSSIASPLTLGLARPGGDSHGDFNGLMDNVRLFDRPLGPAEVAGLYGGGAGAQPYEAPDVSGIDVVVTGDSEINSQSASPVVFKSLTMMDGARLTTSGTGSIGFDDPTKAADTIIDPLAQAVTFDLQVATDYGTIDANLAQVTITKEGPIDLVLQEPNTTFDNATFNAGGGRLIIVHEGIGDADLMLSGGEMILAGRTDRTDVAFHAPTVEADGILTAGPDTVGAAGPLTVTLGSQTEGMALNSGTLTVHTLDNYSLYVPGTISGPGNMDLVAGTVTTDSPVSIGNLSVSGTLTAAGITAADVDINPGARVTSSGPITADNLNVSGGLDLTGSGPQRNVTINPGGTLSLIGSNLDLEGATLEASQATVSIAWGRTLVYDKALTVANLDLAGTYTVMGTEPGSRDVTISPGGQLKLGSGAILNMTGLTSGTLTTTGSDVVVDRGDLRVANDFEANNVAVTDGGRMDTDGKHVTIQETLQLGSVTYSRQEGPFQAGGPDFLRDVNLTVNGGTLTIAGLPSYPEGAVGIWTFDDGNDLGHDSSGNDYHGILQGDPTAAVGQLGGAIELDGDGDYVEIPYPDDFNFTDAVTVSAWINVAAFDTTWQAIVAKGEGNRWRLHRHSADSYLNWNASGDLDSTTSPTIGQWHHLVAVHNEAHELLLYVDGVLDAGPLSGSPMGTSNSSVMIGENPDAMGREFNGLIDDVCIYDRGLTLDDVNALYGDGNGPSSGGEVNQPTTHLRLTDDTVLEIDSDFDAVFGDLTLQPGADLTVTGPPAVSFNDITTGPTATITLLDEPPPGLVRGGIFIRGVLSPGGNEPGLLTVDGIFELGDFAGYACTLADWNPDANPDPWNENPPLVVNDKITITGNLEAYLAGTLTLRATSKLRVVGQFEQQWYGDQTRTIMDTVGESTISDWGSFLDVPAAGTHLGHGVFATDQGANGQPVTQTFTTVKVDVFQAADGDGNGDRYLNSDDILAILGANTFGTGLPADWGTGDYNADGICNSDDIQAILATNLWDPFSNLPYAAVEPGDPGDGVVELMVNPADGMLVISADDVTINSYVIKSSAGIFTGEAADNLGFFVEDTDTRVSGSFAFTLLGQHELGRVIGSEWEILAKDDVDLTFTYTVQGAAGTFEGNLIIIPEPGTVVLLALGVLCVLGHRWRKRTPPARS